MKNSTVATSVKLPVGAGALLNEITKSLHISKTQFMRDAIWEKMGDILDVKLAEEILDHDKKRYSFAEVMHALSLDN